MRHKTYRELQNYNLETRKKFAKVLDEIKVMDLETVIKLQEVISQMIWLSFQSVEEVTNINQKAETNEQESI